MSALDKQEGGQHYQLPIQPIEYIVKNSIPYREANVIKYVTRHASKNGAEDIKKAIHYLEMILEDYAQDTPEDVADNATGGWGEWINVDGDCADWFEEEWASRDYVIQHIPKDDPNEVYCGRSSNTPLSEIIRYRVRK